MTQPSPGEDSDSERLDGELVGDGDPVNDRDRFERDDDDIDRRFGQIVADFGPTPSAADHVEPTSPHTSVTATSRGPAADKPDSPTVDDQVDEGEHFVPAKPDPLPAGDLHFWAIVIGLTLGPLLIFLSAALSAVPGMPFGGLGVLLTIVGFVLLVLRSPHHRSGDEGSGARV